MRRPRQYCGLFASKWDAQQSMQKYRAQPPQGPVSFVRPQREHTTRALFSPGLSRKIRRASVQLSLRLSIEFLLSGSWSLVLPRKFIEADGSSELQLDILAGVAQ